jgi:hypothetical protein
VDVNGLAYFSGNKEKNVLNYWLQKTAFDHSDWDQQGEVRQHHRDLQLQQQQQQPRPKPPHDYQIRQAINEGIYYPAPGWTFIYIYDNDLRPNINISFYETFSTITSENKRLCFTL